MTIPFYPIGSKVSVAPGGPNNTGPVTDYRGPDNEGGKLPRFFVHLPDGRGQFFPLAELTALPGEDVWELEIGGEPLI